MSGVMNMLLGARTAIAAAVDEFFNRVTLLLPGDGTNGAQNNTFLDSSTNNFTITRNGNTTQGTFTPFSQTGWSNFFPNAANDSIGVTSTNAAFALGTGDFTIECWVNPTNTTYSQGFFHINTAVNSTVNGYGVGITAAGLVQYYGASTFTNTNVTVTSGLWYHIALVRSSGTLRIYINGVSPSTGGSISDSQNLGNSVCYIGLFYATTGFCMTGYVSNFRVTKGGALYTSSFTPSTTPLTTTVSSGTVSFLTSQSNRFVDNSASPLTLTIAGSPSVQAFEPFAPGVAYSAATVGGSGYFDGTGDYLATPSNAAFGFGTGDYTMECWVYPIPAGKISRLFEFSSNNDNLDINSSSSSYVVGGVSYFNGSSSVGNSSAGVQNYAWNHIVLQRTSGTVRVYVNALSVLTQASTPNTSTRSLAIGGSSSDATFSLFYGYISSLRVVKGTAVYSGTSTTTPNFTLPTAPLTDITNTQLLTNFTNAGITDATAKNVLETVGNAQISTTQSKFGGSSMYFDGNGDYLSLPARPVLNVSGGRQFTIEFWVYTSSTARQNICIDTASGQYWDLCVDNLKINFRYNNAGVSITTSASITSGAWNHVAVCWTGSAMRIFINGTMDSANSTTSMTSHGDAITILGYSNYAPDPQWMNGYIDDFRITNGYARYTGNFTAPTTAFSLQ